jgi:hypothetical protein
MAAEDALRRVVIYQEHDLKPKRKKRREQWKKRRQ